MNKIFSISGRMSRWQYIRLRLISLPLLFLALIPFALVKTKSDQNPENILLFIGNIFLFGILLIGIIYIAVLYYTSFRKRMHDIGITIAYPHILNSLKALCKKGVAGENEFGPDPLLKNK